MQAALRAWSRCTEELVACQLPNGGWSYTARSAQAAVEPTALALLTLPPNAIPERDAAIAFLLRVQNQNGSWPTFVGDDENGSGFTGLALYALRRSGVQEVATDRAIRWILRARGRESGWLWRWKFRTFDRHVRFDPSKSGWPWMPETVSWVVPTSYSLLALRYGSHPSRPVRLRIRRGVEMLYDRVCSGGGWNAGNGAVYGSPMAPHLDTTAIGLLALQGEPANQLITSSLDWLRRGTETCFAPWSLAWTILALNAFGHPTERPIQRLAALAEPAEISDCGTLAVTAMALSCPAGLNPFGVRP